MTTPEQQARDMLGRMGFTAADFFSAGALVELANLIAERDALKAELERVKAERDGWGKRWHQERRKLAELRYPGMTGVVKPMVEELAAIKGAGEPVAWSVTMGGAHTGNVCGEQREAINLMNRLNQSFPDDKRAVVPLYTRPAVPLTEESIRKIAGGGQFVDMVFADGARGIALDAVTICDFARAIEAHIKGA